MTSLKWKQLWLTDYIFLFSLSAPVGRGLFGMRAFFLSSGRDVNAPTRSVEQPAASRVPGSLEQPSSPGMRPKPTAPVQLPASQSQQQERSSWNDTWRWWSSWDDAWAAWDAVRGRSWHDLKEQWHASAQAWPSSPVRHPVLGEAYLPGRGVIFGGLSEWSDLNGQEGAIIKWLPDLGRWHVRLPDGTTKAVRAANITGAPDTNFTVTTERIALHNAALGDTVFSVGSSGHSHGDLVQTTEEPVDDCSGPASVLHSVEQKASSPA